MIPITTGAPASRNITAPEARLCVFAKAPTAGAVKTRLEREHGARGASNLARAFFCDTLDLVKSIPWADSLVATTGPLPVELATHAPARIWSQGHGDLGARMERVLSRALDEAPAAIALGTDSPGMPSRLLEQARDALRTHDAVLGPADDGGFYLLGLRRCPPGLLSDLPWSSPETLAHTEARLRSRGLRTARIEPWFDVDTPEDLARLRALLDDGTLHAPATARTLRAPRVSVIIPVLEEARRIDATLSSLDATPGLFEVIVVDGGSHDDTVARARAHPGTRLVHTPRGRAVQMNAGARVATGEILLFLHADTTLPPDAVAHIERALTDPRVIAGAFRTWTVADVHPAPWFAPLLHLADARSRYSRVPYGDQGLFVRRTDFARAGGFAEIPLMEDLEFSRRLRRLGRVEIVPARVIVSGRRFIARPVFYTAVVNVFPALYRLGVSPAVLARIYRNVR